MHLIQCVNAYTAILALSDRECDYKTAHGLVLLKHRLQPHVEFFALREMELVSEYAAKDENGRPDINDRGKFVFADPVKAEEYAARRAELGMVDVQESFPLLHVSMPATIRPMYLEALEGFLIFDDKEEDGGGEV